MRNMQLSYFYDPDVEFNTSLYMSMNGFNPAFYESNAD
jgi:hypothetical protein